MITIHNKVNRLLFIVAVLLGPLLLVVALLNKASTERATGAAANIREVNPLAQHQSSASVDGIRNTSTVQNVEVHSVSDDIGWEVFKEELESFLNQPVASIDSDWGKVKEEDLKALRVFFDAIIRAKWEEDVDGNVPVEFKIYVLQN